MAIQFKKCIWLKGRAGFSALSGSAEGRIPAIIADVKSALPRTIMFLLAVCIWLPLQAGWANNIAVTNVTYTDLSNGTADVQFDLNWDNSWRISSNAANWDAAWVFVKYQINPTNMTTWPTTNMVPWEHCTILTNNYTAPSGGTVTVPGDKVGAFIYRSGNSEGDNNFTGIKLRWDTSGANMKPDDDVLVQVFAIEMVYVPQGSFYVGDGGTGVGRFEAGTSGVPFQITNEGAFLMGGSNDPASLGNNNAVGMFVADDFNDTTMRTNPAAFPKGYAAFYCSKYQISQGQYVEFLNKLTSTQFATRQHTAKPGQPWRYSWDTNTTWPNLTGAQPDVAMGAPTWTDCMAYCDWAALRPMTELEFEKACRGTNTPVLDEYAWGTTNVRAATPYYDLANSNTASEIVTNPASGTGNANYGRNTAGIPFRCGIFAGSITNPTREEAGASFYGIMSMCDAAFERYMAVGLALGRTFTGLHGDGYLTSAGVANVENWPATGLAGGTRGTSMYHDTSFMRISDRQWACRANPMDTNERGTGPRPGRTAP